MYCKDLKQMLDDMAMNNVLSVDASDNWKLSGIEKGLEFIKNHPGYPKQSNEHNALDDAIWNKKLYEFLITL